MGSSWVKKLRGRSAHELWTRGRQSVSAAMERLKAEGRHPLPGGSSFASMLTPAFARERDPALMLLARFQRREGARFFCAFDDLRATAAAAKALAPDEARSLVRRAEEVENGCFDLLGYRGLSFGDPIDWQLDPVAGVRAPLIHWSRIPYLDTAIAGDHKVVWELNRHQYFLTLGQATCLTGDDRHLRTCVEHLQQWMDANPPKLGVNWCSSLEIAFRSISWLWALHFLRDSELLTAALFERVLVYLHLNARHLENYLSTYFSPNTHLTGEALGLVYIGTLLPELRDAERWRETGWSTLERTLAKQVYADGVYFEQASHYQRYTVDFIVHALLLDQENGGSHWPALSVLLEKLLVHLVHLRRPDGSTPLIGDDDGGRLAPLDTRPIDDHAGTLSTGATLLSHGLLAQAAGSLATETIWLLGASASSQFDAIVRDTSVPASRLFPDGGYGIMRDDWSADAGHLIVDCGPHGAMSGAHAHADALSVQLSVNGRAALVDAGTYTYSEPAERDYFRGAFAHSVAILDEVPPSVPAGAFAWRRSASSTVDSWHSDSTFDYLIARHDGYRELDPDVVVSRAVLGLKGRYWVLRDRVQRGAAHSLQLHFHCAEEVLASQDGTQLRLTQRDGTSLLTISSFGLVGGANPSYSIEQGWTSRCYGHRTSSWHGILHCERRDQHDLVSFLIPEADAVVRELTTEVGRRFEISSSQYRDVLVLGDGRLVDDGRISTLADLTWLRWDRRDDRLTAIVLVKATQLSVDGMELLRDGDMVDELSAKIIDDAWKVSSPGLSMERWGVTSTSGRSA